MANGVPSGNGLTTLPPWLAPIATLITQVGVPTVFAGVLLWFVLTRVGSTLDTIEANEAARTKLLQDTQLAFIQAIERSADRFEASIDKNIATNRELAERYNRSPPAVAPH